MEDGRSDLKILSGKNLNERSLGRPRQRWEVNIRMEFNVRNWVDSAQDRGYWRALANATLNLLVS